MKTHFVVFCLFTSLLFLSLSLRAEESYERFTVRTWTYRDGTQAEGKMITVSGPTATLKLEGKGNVRVPLEKLSVKDLNWIYEYHRRKKKLSFLPPKYRQPQKDLSEAKPAPEKSEPATAKTEKKQPEKEMTTAEPKVEESYQPFTVREWTLKEGDKFQAKFLHIVMKKAILIKERAQSMQVPLDQLSEKDLDWLAEYHRRNKMLALFPAEYRDRVAKSQPGSGSTSKPVANKMSPNLPQTISEKLAEQKAKSEAMRAESIVKAAKEDDPDVIKANTDIDPTLVAALREFRVWSDKQGKKSEAMFSAIDGREVLFVTRTTGFVRVHIGTLIEEDLQLLRDALKMHGRFDEIPLVYREPLDPNLTPSKLKHVIKVNNQRKWTDLSGNTVGASYVKMEEGMVSLLITKNSVVEEFPYLNFIPEDQEYVQGRLQKEIPGNFSPAGAEVTLTPEERENEFRVWTDRNKRQIKGKFVRLAYGESVAVINTGEKEELFIAAFFSDPDLSLLKPPQKKQTNQLALNNMTPNRGGTNRGMGMNPFSNPAPNGGGTGMSRTPGMNSLPGMSQPQWEFTCPLCKKKHKSDFGIFQECPHCKLKSTDSLYTCKTCNRTFKANFQGLEAPCPHCNKNQPNRQVASGNTSPFMSGGSGGNAKANESGSSRGIGVSDYRTGRLIGKICGWILLFIGFIVGVNKVRG